MPNKLYIGYMSEEEGTIFFGDQVPRQYRIVDPRTGEIVREGELQFVDNRAALQIDSGPRVIICHEV